MKKTPICRDLGAASTLLRQLGSADRLGIVCLLMEGERSVTELEAALGIRQPTLSQQITVLREAGLIAGRRVGRHVCYTVCDRRAQAIVEALRGLYAELLPASAILATATRDTSRQDLAAAVAIGRLAEMEGM